MMKDEVLGGIQQNCVAETSQKRGGQLANPWPDGGQSHVLQGTEVKCFRATGPAGQPIPAGRPFRIRRLS